MLILLKLSNVSYQNSGRRILSLVPLYWSLLGKYITIKVGDELVAPGSWLLASVILGYVVLEPTKKIRKIYD